MIMETVLGKNSVYPPREDSFLLAKAVKVKTGSRTLDMGTGSGIQGLTALRKGASYVLATDMEDSALEVAKEKFKVFVESKQEKKVNHNSKIIEFRKSNLFSNISLDEKFDLIIFNPPYLWSEEIKDRQLDGGRKGRELLDKFITGFPLHLGEKGVCYFLQSSLNGLEETRERLRKLKIKYEIVAKKHIFFEDLIVLRCEFAY